jgi:hypothetical protein
MRIIRTAKSSATGVGNWSGSERPQQIDFTSNRQNLKFSHHALVSSSTSETSLRLRLTTNPANPADQGPLVCQNHQRARFMIWY